MALDQASGTAPIISATGPVSFRTGSKVALVPSTFLPDSGTYTLIHSGGLSFADFAAATSAQPIPFIFNGAITRNANDLVLTLQRKTAAQLGLTGNVATIYEPLAKAALADHEFGAALLTLGTAAEVQAVIDASVPDVAGAVRALSIAGSDHPRFLAAHGEQALKARRAIESLATTVTAPRASVTAGVAGA